jgi:DNA-directed RNA polymerase sigma subunit (sigma70/sigma32)
MANTTETQQGQGFYWDKRGKVTATWVQRDLDHLRRLISFSDPQMEKPIAAKKQRIADQIAAYIGKLATGVTQHKTLEHFGRLTAEFDLIAGTDYAIQLATAAAAKLAQRQPLPWDVRGRVVPTWMKRAAKSLKNHHARLAVAEQALAKAEASKQAELKARVDRQREVVLKAEARLTAMAEDGASRVDANAWHVKPATAKTVKHIASSLDDVKAAAALAAGSSFSQDRYDALEKKLRSALMALPGKKGFLRERDDAIQQGRLGIQHAAKRWDVGHPLRAKFSSYAPLWIGRFMECRTDDAVAADKHRKGAPKKRSMDVHEYDDERTDFKHPVAPDNTARTAFVNLLLEQLTPIERTVVERVIMKSESLAEVARTTGLTVDMVRNIRDEAIDRISR